MALRATLRRPKLLHVTFHRVSKRRAPHDVPRTHFAANSDVKKSFCYSWPRVQPISCEVCRTMGPGHKAQDDSGGCCTRGGQLRSCAWPQTLTSRNAFSEYISNSMLCTNTPPASRRHIEPPAPRIALKYPDSCDMPPPAQGLVLLICAIFRALFP